MKKFSVLNKAIAIIAIVFFLVIGCKKDPSLTGATEDDTIEFLVPANWPEPVYKFQNNTLTKAGFELGRKLFYETKLSRDNTVSCGSCHQPFAAFAHIDHTVSHGVDNLIGNRNSPPIFNLNWHTSFFLGWRCQSYRDATDQSHPESCGDG